MPSKDPALRQANNRRYYAKNVESINERNRRNRQACAELIRVAKDRPCADCGQRYPYFVMDFDHREGQEKLFHIGGSWSSGHRLKIMAEIEKCDVVCSNCHRIRTARRNGWVPEC